MNVFVVRIEWEYPGDRLLPVPELWDLAKAARRTQLRLLLTDGALREMRLEATTAAALLEVRDAVRDEGRGIPIEPDEAERARLWLRRDGDECWLVGPRGPAGAYVFVRPEPRPWIRLA